jgi:ABC-type uncharacterized transport system substrate-binding protein
MNVPNDRLEHAGSNRAKRTDSKHSGKPGFLGVGALLLLFSIRPSSAWARVALVVESQQAALGFQQSFADTDEVEKIYLEGNRLPDILRKERPRLVVAIGTQAAKAAKERFPDLPILYCLVLRPVENRLIGTNIGGIALEVELPQQVENIQKVLPKLRRIGVIYDELTSGQAVTQARQYLSPHVQVVARNVRTAREAAQQIRDLFGNVLNSQDAFWLLWDPVIANPANFKLLVNLSLEYKVPVIAPARPFVEAGALISVGADYVKAGQQTARIAQQLLKNEAKPEDFRAEPPQELVVTINGEVARKLGIRFPPDLRAEILTAP